MSAPTGNRCGHDPKKPRLDPVESPEGLPLILYDVAAAAENVYWMRRRRDFRAYYRCRKPRPRSPTAKGKVRSHEYRRSELAEVLVLVIKTLAFHADLVTGRVQAGKTRDDGSVCGVTARYLADVTGCSLSRVNRALGVLVHEDLITSCQPAKLKDDGTYEGYPAIRTLTPKLLRLLHVSMKWEIASKKAHKKREEAKAAAATSEAQAMQERIRRQRDRANRRNAARIKRVVERKLPGADQGERGQRLMALQLAVRLKHPDWDPERQRRLALSQLDE